MKVVEKILIALLKTPQRTGEIALELGYVDPNGYGNYKNIEKPLKRLVEKGYIYIPDANTHGARGAPATTYDLVWAISFLREMIREYPSLVLDFQKNERIISIFIHKQNILYRHPPNEAELNMLKNMLCLSHAFFSRYVDDENFLNIFSEWWSEVNQNLIADSNITFDYKLGSNLNLRDQGNFIISLDSEPFTDTLRNAFEHSLITDKMNKRFNPESFKILEKISMPKGMNFYPKNPKGHPEFQRKSRKIPR